MIRLHLIHHLFLLVCLTLTHQAYSHDNQTLNAKIDSVINQYVNNRAFSGSVLLAKEGSIIYHKAFGLAKGYSKNDGFSGSSTIKTANTINTQFGIGSLSKTITAVMVMQLVQNNQLNLDDKIGLYLPHLSKEKGQHITIHHLLSHRSGLPNYFEIPGWTNGRFDKSLSLQAFAKVIEQLPLKYVPGSRYEYSNSGYFLLGKIIESITGKSYERVLQEKILIPAKMTNTGIQLNDNKPKFLATSYQFSANSSFEKAQINTQLFRAAGDLYSTTDDLFRFEQALYDETLLNEYSQRILFDADRSYGWNQFSIQVGHQALELVSYSGQLMGFNAILTRVPKDKVSIILLGNIGTSYHERLNITGEILNTIHQVAQPESKLRASLRLHRALFEGDLLTVIKRIKSGDEITLVDPQGIQSLANQVGWSGLAQQKKAILQLLEPD